MVDYQRSYSATPTEAQENQRSLVCPPPPEPRKHSITFDGMNFVLPFQLSSESDPTSGPDDELDREVIFSLKPRSSFIRTLSEGLTTNVAIDSLPPPPFGYTQLQAMGGSPSNPNKLPSQARPRPFAQAKQRHTLNARCA